MIFYLSFAVSKIYCFRVYSTISGGGVNSFYSFFLYMYLANCPSKVAAPPGCRPSGIGRVNVVTNVRGLDQGARAGPDHGRDGPARGGNVVTNIFFGKAVDMGAGSGII